MKKFTQRDLQLAIGRLGMCRFFPADAPSRAAIEALLARMCPHKEALEWLVDEFINRINDWQGPGELRGVLCTRYKPDDGIEANCSIPGYRPQDGEAICFDRHQQLKVEGLADVPNDPEEHRRLAGMDVDSRRLLIEGMKKDWPQ